MGLVVLGARLMAIALMAMAAGQRGTRRDGRDKISNQLPTFLLHLRRGFVLTISLWAIALLLPVCVDELGEVLRGVEAFAFGWTVPPSGGVAWYANVCSGVAWFAALRRGNYRSALFFQMASVLLSLEAIELLNVYDYGNGPTKVVHSGVGLWVWLSQFVLGVLVLGAAWKESRCP